MSENTGNLILSQLKQIWSKMADCIDDVVHNDEPKGSVNYVNVFIIGWVTIGIIIYIVGLFISSRLHKKTENVTDTTYDNNIPVDGLTAKEENTLNVAKTKPNDLEIHQRESEEIEEPTCSMAQTSQLQSEPYSESPVEEPEPIPQTTGTNKLAVQWINKVLEWIYTNSSIACPIFVDSWISALNNKLQKLAPEHGIVIELDSNLVAKQFSSPVLSDVHTSLDPKGNVVTTALFHCPPMSCMLASATLDGPERRYRFRLKMDHLAATVKADYQPEIQTFILQYVGKPDFSLTIHLLSGEDAEDPDADIPQERILDLLYEAFQTLDAELTFTYTSDFPPYKKAGPILENGSAGTPIRTPPPIHKLLVKVIKAYTHAEIKGGLVCVLELDSPHQRYETTAARESPFWDELFYFDISPSSNCLLVSLLSCGGKSIGSSSLVGEAQVDIQEILRNPSHRQILPLQVPEADCISLSGNLTLEFLVNGGEDFPHLGIGHGKIIEMNSRFTSSGTVIKTTTIKKTTEDDEVDDIMNTALRQLEVSHNGTAASKSTLIIHSVQKVKKPKQMNNEGHDESSQLSPNSANGEDILSTEPKEQGQHNARPKERKSLMNTIRKRLSFRRAGNRSKSADQYSQNGDSRDKSRSASSDRSSHRAEKYLNIPKGEETNGSLSEASAISGSSNRTFVNERSTLILETTENGVTRRYIVPNTMSHGSRKWGKPAGVKLHVFNEHTFVARHISGVAKCNVCQQQLTRRPGKQGYVCRDCNFLCHKACHVKAETACPSSTINTLEVEYMQEPPRSGSLKPKTS